MLTALTRLLASVRAAGHPTWYVAVCCDRLYVGMDPASGCRVCHSTPKSVLAEAADTPEAVLARLR